MKSTNSLIFAAGVAFTMAAFISIGPVAGASNGLKRMPTAAAANEPTKLAPATVAVPLTSAECRGLGGTIHSTIKCGRSNQKACSTVDYDGVIRTACIDEAKQ